MVVNTNVAEIKYLVYHDPRALKFMFRDPTEDKRRLSAIIGRLIPYRVGIEFELFGTLSHLSGIKPLGKQTTTRPLISTHKKMSYEDQVKKAMIKKFNLVDYSEDKYYWNEKEEISGNLNEIRVSIKGVHQLNSLWEICKVLNENCKIPSEKGGIHIHIDLTELINNYPDAKDYANRFLNRKSYLSRILNIFGGYKGNYNKKGAAIATKGYWINISNKNTIEFRIGSLNFNYRIIIRWIIELSKIVTELRTAMHNNVAFISDIDCLPIPETNTLVGLDVGESPDESAISTTNVSLQGNTVRITDATTCGTYISSLNGSTYYSYY